MERFKIKFRKDAPYTLGKKLGMIPGEIAEEFMCKSRDSAYLRYCDFLKEICETKKVPMDSLVDTFECYVFVAAGDSFDSFLAPVEKDTWISILF